MARPKPGIKRNWSCRFRDPETERHICLKRARETETGRFSVRNSVIWRGLVLIDRWCLSPLERYREISINFRSGNFERFALFSGGGLFIHQLFSGNHFAYSFNTIRYFGFQIKLCYDGIIAYQYQKVFRRELYLRLIKSLTIIYLDLVLKTTSSFNIN